MAGPSRPATRSCRSRTITIRRFITATSATRVDPNVPAAGLAGLGGLRGTTFVDPADPGAGFHYHGPALVAREPEAVEHAREASLKHRQAQSSGWCARLPSAGHV